MDVALFVAQQATSSSGASTLLLFAAIIGALGGGAGVTAIVRGVTTDRRAQRLAEDKASREELEGVRAENRQLRKEVSDLNSKAFNSEQRASDAMIDKRRAEDRLERVERELAEEKQRTVELALRVAELEGKKP